MGTRSLIHFKSEADETLCTVYRQFDGYPDGRGQELADFLKTRKLINGINGQKMDVAANGMGCLAAQWVAQEKDDIGGVYMYTPDADNCWEEYTYTVFPGKDGVILMTCDGDENESFSGSPHDFEAWSKEL